MSREADAVAVGFDWEVRKAFKAKLQCGTRIAWAEAEPGPNEMAVAKFGSDTFVLATVTNAELKAVAAKPQGNRPSRLLWEHSMGETHLKIVWRSDLK